MADNISRVNGRDNFAFTGDRGAIWHRKGTQKKESDLFETWAPDAGLDYDVIKVPAYADMAGLGRVGVDRLSQVDGRFFIVRADNGDVLSPSTVSKLYQPVQPAALLEWFKQYVGVDDRFQMSAAGVLGKGETVFATAVYRDDLIVAGERHLPHLLMSTTFDGTGATINQGTVIRVVCKNTLAAAHLDARAKIKTRHNTKFNAEAVSKELAGVAQGFATFKAVGDAMASVHMSKAAVSEFFKEVLEIPFDAKSDEISTRKNNQFKALSDAYRTSVREGAEKDTVWAALQAVTRYVDHDRSVKSGDGDETTARWEAANFGSGAVLKGKAVNILRPRFEDKVKVPA